MNDHARAARLHHFIEEMGLLIEQAGGVRMMGRVLGYLLICDPPEQSAGDLAEALHASAGSISTTTRQLVTGGLVDRVARPGDRKTYFRYRQGAEIDLMRARAGLLSLYRDAADHGLALLQDAPPERRVRLEDFRDFYAFMEAQIPEMIEHWHAHRAARAAEEDR